MPLQSRMMIRCLGLCLLMAHIGVPHRASFGGSRSPQLGIQSRPSIWTTNQQSIGTRHVALRTSPRTHSIFFAHGYLFASRFLHEATRVYPSVRRGFRRVWALLPLSCGQTGSGLGRCCSCLRRNVFYLLDGVELWVVRRGNAGKWQNLAIRHIARSPVHVSQSAHRIFERGLENTQ